MKWIKNKKSINTIVCFLFGVVLVSTLVTSCVKDNFDFGKLQAIEWNPNIAAPLVYSSLTIGDLVAKEGSGGLITVGSDNFCTLMYKGNLLSLKASDLIVIPDNQPPPYVATLNSGQITAFGLAGTITVPYSQTITFDSGVNGPKMDSLILKGGSISISLSSTFQFSGQIQIVLPGAIKNGMPFTQVIPFTYSGTTPVTSTVTVDLTGYHFDLTHGGTTFNEFVADFQVTLTGSGNPISSSDQITLTQNLTNLKFDKIYGDIGQMSLSPDVDTVDISIFKSVLGAATFSLVDPRIKVVIANSYGVPINATLSQFDGYTPGATPFPITGAPNPLPIQSPTFSQVGQVLTDSFSLNNSNSNIATVINNTPKSLIYKMSTLTNPAGGSTHNNFVIDTSRIDVDMEVELPLYGTASNFILADTMPFELTQTLPEQVESALIRTFNSNGFPFDVDMQIYFADSLYTKLDSLVIPNQLVLASATVNSSTGIVISPTQKTYDATLTKSRLLNLKTTKYLLILAKANTTNNGTTPVKIYANYKLDFKLGLQVQVKAKI
jgi:hypothetical protein